MVETSEIAEATPAAVEISPAGDLLVRWARIGVDDTKAEHVSVYPLDWLNVTTTPTAYGRNACSPCCGWPRT